MRVLIVFACLLGVALGFEAPPRPLCGCPPDTPVCGSDLKTYANKCTMNCFDPTLFVLAQGTCDVLPIPEQVTRPPKPAYIPSPPPYYSTPPYNQLPYIQTPYYLPSPPPYVPRPPPYVPSPPPSPYIPSPPPYVPSPQPSRLPYIPSPLLREGDHEQ